MTRKLRRSKKTEYELVPIRENTVGFPTVNYSVPDTSFWRVDRWTNRASAIVTVAPDGLELGWDACGSCSVGFYGCQCQAGISLPNSIGYVFTTRGGVKPPPPPPLAVMFEAPKPHRSLRRTSAPVPLKPKRSLRRKKEVVVVNKAQVAQKQPRRLKRR